MTRAIALGPWIDKHVRVWVALLTVAVLALIVVSAVQFQASAKNAAQVAREQAIRISTGRSAVKAQYERCYASIPQLATLNVFLTGENAVAHVQFTIASALVENSARALAASPASDPLDAVRRKNLGDLLNARSDAALAEQQVAALKAFPVPTEAECARESGVPASQRHR